MYRATITIYSEFDPAKVELSALAREAEEGSAIVADYKIEPVEAHELPESAAEFFSVEDLTP